MDWLISLTQMKLDPGAAIIFAAVSSILAVSLRTVPGMLWERIKMGLTIRVIIDENDNMAGRYHFAVFNEWVGKNRISWLTRLFEVNDERKIVAGTGFNVVRFKGCYFWCYMNREKPQGTTGNPVAIGSYALYTWKWNRGLVKELIDVSMSRPKRAFVGNVYTIDERTISDGTLYPAYIKDQPQLISKDTLDQLKSIFDKFVQGPEAYHSQFIPHKETIMLYGPPGTGKTSVIRHLCALYNLDLVLISPASITTNSLKWKSWDARHHGGRTVYLIEDIDSNKAFLKKELDMGSSNITISTSSDMDSSIMGGGTISDLLNALDGPEPLDNAMVFMTSNHRDKLESSIYRVGRVDHLIPVNYIELSEALGFLDWGTDDNRYQRLVADPRATCLPAGTLNMLKFSKNTSDVDKVLAGKELSLDEVA